MGTGRSRLRPGSIRTGPHREGDEPKLVMHGDEKSDPAIVCAGQRPDREGSSLSNARMRSAVSKSGVMPRWPKRAEGMEQSKRARRRKPETAKANLEPPLTELRRTGC